jgi:hypothetical protein
MCYGQSNDRAKNGFSAKYTMYFEVHGVLRRQGSHGCNVLPVTVFDSSSVYLVSLEVRQVRSAVPETTTPKHLIYV